MSEEATAAPADPGTTAAGEAGTGVAAAAPAGADGQPWHVNLGDELKGYVENKGWKDPAAVVESYRNAEKLLGVPEDQVIKMPKHDAPLEEWNKAVWNKLGRPEAPEGYGIQPPEGGDATFAEWASGTFHELGVPREMGAKIAEKYEEFVGQMQTQQQEAMQAAVAQEQEGLRKEWGAAYDQNKAIAARAAQEFGLDAETIDLLESQVGYAKVMDFFHNIGSKMGEADFVNGQTPTGFGVMTPEQAQSRIGALRNDAEFTKRYVNGDAAARDEMERLHKWAYPES